jgi:hypothetical protein
LGGGGRNTVFFFFRAGILFLALSVDALNPLRMGEHVNTEYLN